MGNLNSVTAVVAKHPKAAAKALAKMGKGEDTVLAHLEPWEARLLDRSTDGGEINPRTGIPMFGDGMGGSDNPGGGHNADGSASSGGYGGGGSSSSSSTGSSSTGGSDQTGVSPGVGFGFSPSEPSYGGLIGPVDTTNLSYTDISNFGGIGKPGSGTIGPNGEMDNFAGAPGALTDSFSAPENMGAPAPAKYDPLASPVSQAPQRPDVRKAVDAWNNTVGKMTSLRQEVGWDPAKGALAPHNYVDINPTSLALGALTGLPVGQLMSFFDINDPYSTSVDLGYGTDTPAGPGNSDGADAYARSGPGAGGSGSGPVLTNPGTITPSTPGSSYVAPSTPLSSVTPVGQTKLRARRGFLGDYAPNFKTSAV